MRHIGVALTKMGRYIGVECTVCGTLGMSLDPDDAYREGIDHLRGHGCTVPAHMIPEEKP